MGSNGEPELVDVEFDEFSPAPSVLKLWLRDLRADFGGLGGAESAVRGLSLAAYAGCGFSRTESAVRGLERATSLV